MRRRSFEDGETKEDVTLEAAVFSPVEVNSADTEGRPETADAVCVKVDSTETMSRLPHARGK
jgi:hypothetical protein